MKNNYLKNLIIEISTICPLNCKHCYLPSNQRKYMSFDFAKQIIDSAYDMKVLKLTFTGGEVLTHPNLQDILKYAHDKGFCVNVLSSLFTHKKSDLDFLAKYCHQLGVSLYGHIPMVHDEITQKKGSYQVTVDNIKYLKDRINNIRVNVTILQDNFKYYNEIKFFVDMKLKINNTFNFRVFDLKNNRNYDEICMTKRQAVEYLNNFDNNQLLTSTLNICSAGRNELTIDVDGNACPCVFFPVKLGNLHQSELNEIWFNNSYLNEIRSIEINDFEMCLKCEKLQFCHQCIGNNYFENKSINIPSKQNCDFCNIYFEAYYNKQKGSDHH